MIVMQTECVLDQVQSSQKFFFNFWKISYKKNKKSFYVDEIQSRQIKNLIIISGTSTKNFICVADITPNIYCSD